MNENDPPLETKLIAPPARFNVNYARESTLWNFPSSKIHSIQTIRFAHVCSWAREPTNLCPQWSPAPEFTCNFHQHVQWPGHVATTLRNLSQSERGQKKEGFLKPTVVKNQQRALFQRKNSLKSASAHIKYINI